MLHSYVQLLVLRGPVLTHVPPSPAYLDANIGSVFMSTACFPARPNAVNHGCLKDDFVTITIPLPVLYIQHLEYLLPFYLL
jgi:hypothetical protein